MSYLRHAIASLFLLGSAATLAAGCAAPPEDLEDEGEYGVMEQEISSSKTVGNWSKFPDGEQCLAAIQMFYPARFGADVPYAGEGWKGNCGPHGACHIWLDKIPDAGEWERIPNDGKHLPTTYDMIVYPPSGSNIWGHIASVDHVEGKTIFVMDDNYVAHEKKASKPHTVSTKAYGWYHLKKLGAAGPSSGGSSGGSTGNSCVAGGTYCGGDKVKGASDTLYECQADGSAKKLQECSRGCAVRPGRDDACRTCVVGGLYCGGDKLEGDSGTLYKCNEQGLGDLVKHCAKGCAVHAGSDDACK
ncbi:MAG: CHAP domain-containing protein [Byssovorax sp.]